MKKGYILVTGWDKTPYHTIEYFDQYQDAFNTLYMDNYHMVGYKYAYIYEVACVYNTCNCKY